MALEPVKWFFMEKQPKSENQQLHDQVLRCRNFNKEKEKSFIASTPSLVVVQIVG
jgi:hypothetical protein